MSEDAPRPDPRKVKTERDITAALVQVLTEGRPFRKVTVADICSAALVSRSTFYDHYLDKYDLLTRMVEDIDTQVARVLEDRFRPGADFSTCLRAISDGLFRAHRDEMTALLLIHEPEGDLELRLTATFTRAFRATLDDMPERELVADLYAACALVLLRRSLDRRLCDAEVALVDHLQSVAISSLAPEGSAAGSSRSTPTH